MTGCKWFVEHFLLDCFIYPSADFYCWSASKRLQKTSSGQCKAVKNIRQFHFKGGFFLPVQNLYLFLAQPNCLVHLDLSGTDCTVDSVCIQRLCHSLSTHHRLIASFNMGFSQETWKRRALNMNQLPRKNNVSSAESQALWGQNKRNMSLFMNNATAALHEKHKTFLFHRFVYILTVILSKFSIWLH